MASTCDFASSIAACTAAGRRSAASLESEYSAAARAVATSIPDRRRRAAAASPSAAERGEDARGTTRECSSVCMSTMPAPVQSLRPVSAGASRSASSLRTGVLAMGPTHLTSGGSRQRNRQSGHVAPLTSGCSALSTCSPLHSSDSVAGSGTGAGGAWKSAGYCSQQPRRAAILAR